MNLPMAPTEVPAAALTADQVAEMQAQPWTAGSAFTPANLYASAADYRQEPLSVVLLWGVATWLRDPAWMAAGQHAMAILRS